MSQIVRSSAKIAFKDPHVDYGNVLIECSLDVQISIDGEATRTFNIDEMAKKFNISLRNEAGELKIEAMQRLTRELTVQEYKRFKRAYDEIPRKYFNG